MGDQITTRLHDDPKRKDREFRRFETFEIRSVQIDTNSQQELYVEGYAVSFNKATVLWEYDGVEYKEQIDRKAFDTADMSDVIFNYNHTGKVMARTRNQTLELKIDDQGLFMRARLDGTEEGRKMYEEIQGGYIDRMSFSWSTLEDSYDRGQHLRTVTKIKKLYDVSAVDIPAYDTTSISVRSYFELERDKEKAAVAAELRKRLILKTLL